jgi:transcriptional regulator with XRE-family HTH domain
MDLKQFLTDILTKYTRQEVADRLGVTRQAVAYWVKTGAIPKLRMYELKEKVELDDQQERNTSEV